MTALDTNDILEKYEYLRSLVESEEEISLSIDEEDESDFYFCLEQFYKIYNPVNQIKRDDDVRSCIIILYRIFFKAIKANDNNCHNEQEHKSYVAELIKSTNRSMRFEQLNKYIIENHSYQPTDTVLDCYFNDLEYIQNCFHLLLYDSTHKSKIPDFFNSKETMEIIGTIDYLSSNDTDTNILSEEFQYHIHRLIRYFREISRIHNQDICGAVIDSVKIYGYKKENKDKVLKKVEEIYYLSRYCDIDIFEEAFEFYYSFYNVFRVYRSKEKLLSRKKISATFKKIDTKSLEPIINNQELTTIKLIIHREIINILNEEYSLFDSFQHLNEFKKKSRYKEIIQKSISFNYFIDQQYDDMDYLKIQNSYFKEKFIAK